MSQLLLAELVFRISGKSPLPGIRGCSLSLRARVYTRIIDIEVLRNDFSSADALHCRSPSAELGNNGTALCSTHVVCRGCYFRSHASFTKRTFRRESIGLGHTHRGDRAFFFRAPPGINGIDIGENQEELGAELPRKNRRSEILVHDRIHSFEAEHWIAVDRNAAASARDYNGIMLEQRPNCCDFVNCKRFWTSDDPPKVSLCIFLDRMTLGSQLSRARHRQSVSEEFFRFLERRIICSDFDLCENCYYVSRVSGLTQSIVERLL